MLDYPAILGQVVLDFFQAVNSSFVTQALLVAALLGLNLVFRWIKRSYEDWRADNDSSYGRY